MFGEEGVFSRGFFGWFWFCFFLAFEVGLCRWVMLLGGGGGSCGCDFWGFCVVFVHSGECWLYSRDGSCSVSATHCSWCVLPPDPAEPHLALVLLIFYVGSHFLPGSYVSTGYRQGIWRANLSVSSVNFSLMASVSLWSVKLV